MKLCKERGPETCLVLCEKQARGRAREDALCEDPAREGGVATAAQACLFASLNEAMAPRIARQLHCETSREGRAAEDRASAPLRNLARWAVCGIEARVSASCEIWRDTGLATAEKKLRAYV